MARNCPFFAFLLVGALACCLSGCPSTVPSPCTVDPVGCKSGSTLVIQCQRAGALDVEIGTGESSFTAIDAAHGFLVHHGTQGGEHVFAAVRVTNPALDYPQLRIEFQVLDMFDGEIGYRQLVLGPPLQVVGTRVEQAGIVVFGTLLETGKRIRVTVSDPCGRVGKAEIDFHQ